MVANKFIAFGLIQGGYFFQGQIYFAQRHGSRLCHFEVNNGKISDKKSDFIIYKDEEVEPIHPDNYYKNNLPAR